MKAHDKSVIKMVANMIRQYDVPVTAGQIDDYLFTHPFYPQLISISDAFDEWRIAHASVKVKPHQLSEISTPFLATLKNTDSQLAMVTDVNRDHITYQTLKQKKVTVKMDDFLRDWDGVVIAIDPNEGSGAKDYDREVKKERVQKLRSTVVTVTAIGLLLLSCYNLFTVAGIAVTAVQLFLAAAGLITALFLYTYEKNTAPTFVKEICKQGAEFNCNDVLRSNAGKLFGMVSWAEVGIIYFTGFFLSLLWAANNPNIYYTLALLNVAALPYTFFSVYYQQFVAKKWCVLCLTIQAVFWLQFAGFFLLSGLHLPVINLAVAQILLAAFGLPMLSLLYSDTYIKNSAEVKSLKRASRKIKQNPEVFKSLLYTSRKIDTSYPIDFVLGDPDGRLTITCAISTHCGPCGNTHKLIANLLERFTDVKVQYIFSFDHDQEDQLTVKHLGAVYEQYGREAALEAITLLFETKDIGTVERTYPVDMEKFDGEAFLKLNSKMKSFFQIHQTPMVFINGYELPQLYEAGDLAYWLPYLRQYLIPNYSLIIN
jgi:uncharacterized membrane protein